MKECRFVTSMSCEGYKTYGKKFLESFVKHSDYQMTVYSEDDLNIAHYIRSGYVWPARLQDDPDWREFQNYPDDPPDWRYQAKRFSHKVFALTKPEDCKWWIWLDADVEVFGRLDAEFIKRACPQNATLSYLGRQGRTSECGWVAYNLEKARPFLKRFREIYTSGEIYDHLEWHDSYIFDRVKEEIPGNYHNLSEGIPGMHPWDETILGEKMRHLKGPLRKAGKSLENLPEEYRSARE